MSAAPPDPPSAGRRLVVRWYHVAPLLVALAALLVWVGWRTSRPARPEAPAPGASGSETTEPAPSDGPNVAAEVEVAEAGDGLTELPRMDVWLYWPSADGAGLKAERREIYATARLTDRIRQVAGLALGGPDAVAVPDDSDGEPEPPAEGDAAQSPELVGAFPEGAPLRAVFLDGGNTAWVSIGQQAVDGLHGSASELAATYSLVNSLVRSFAEVQRVRILVEGREVETLAGHLDLRDGLVFSGAVLAPGETMP